MLPKAFVNAYNHLSYCYKHSELHRHWKVTRYKKENHFSIRMISFCKALVAKRHTLTDPFSPHLRNEPQLLEVLGMTVTT